MNAPGSAGWSAAPTTRPPSSRMPPLRCMASRPRTCCGTGSRASWGLPLPDRVRPVHCLPEGNQKRSPRRSEGTVFLLDRSGSSIDPGLALLLQPFALAPYLPTLHQGRNDRDQDDDHDHHREVVLHPGIVAQGVAAGQEDGHPEETPGHIPADELPVGHFADPGHEGYKSADDRDETTQDDRHTAVLLEEGMGA